MKKHVWREGDSLGALAEQHHLPNWQRIWESNPELQAKRGTPENIKPGDEVNIPDVAPKTDNGQGEQLNPFEALGSPAAGVRFVDDRNNPTTPNATPIDTLEISYRVTTHALPAPYWQKVLVPDRRNFRVEVVDTGLKASDRPEVVLEVLKPKLDAKGRPLFVDEKGLPTSPAKGTPQYESTTPKRTLTVRLQRVPTTGTTANPRMLFRSAYLRLVTDERDQAARSRQTLLTDHEPGDLRIEILDQAVKATYKSSKGEPVSRVARVGRDRKRFRMTVQILRASKGGAPPAGVTRQIVYRHVRCWVRRLYAQTNLAPELVRFPAVSSGDPRLKGTAGWMTAEDEALIGVREIDPPRNMLSIYNNGPAGASARAVLSFRLTCDLPPAQAGGSVQKIDKRYSLYPANRPAPVDATLRITENESPEETCKKFARLIEDDKLGFQTKVIRNNLHKDRGRSADLLIWHPSGVPVVVQEARSNDPAHLTNALTDRHRIRATWVNPANFRVTDSDFAGDGANRWENIGTRDVRCVCHNYRSWQAEGADGILDCFVVHRFYKNNIWGFAYGRESMNKNALLRGVHPVLATIYVDPGAVGMNDRAYGTTSHESGHVLGDMWHVVAKTQVMTSGGMTETNTVAGSKRFCDQKLSADVGPAVNVYQNVRKCEAALLLHDWKDYPEYPQQPPSPP
ncbi:MAG: LysM peptidoglycan-binding domain-containing protein [Planctomycetes bacterium]|nr:LysM peptidoglycan-binding domain-containing protein [Planctomycetota bacterium]